MSGVHPAHGMHQIARGVQSGFACTRVSAVPACASASHATDRRPTADQGYSLQKARGGTLYFLHRAKLNATHKHNKEGNATPIVANFVSKNTDTHTLKQTHAHTDTETRAWSFGHKPLAFVCCFHCAAWARDGLGGGVEGRAGSYLQRCTRRRFKNNGQQLCATKTRQSSTFSARRKG